MIAFLESYKAGLLKPHNWLPNIIAGLVVGIVALPLAMAFAIASGLKPEQGLYTAIIAGIIVSLFGGTRVQIAGPTGAFVVILASITARYGVSGLQIATIMAGILLLLMGFLKFGNAIKFIPYPVIVGFTSGIGVVIFVNEWKDFFGLNASIPLDAPFYQKLIMLIKAIAHLDIPTTCLAFVGLLLIIITPRIVKQIPGPLVAMIVVTLAQLFFQYNSVATIGSVFGTISQNLPHFQLPAITYTLFLQLLGPACTIALLSGIESLLSATAADSIAGTKHNSNQELIGQGLANILAPLWTGFASTGAIARTVTNIRYGGNCPIAGIVHAIFLMLVIIIFAPLAGHIPLCALAAILVVVAYNMSDIPEFMHIIKRAPYYDVAVLLITFVLTIFIDLVVAVAVGVILAMLFFNLRMYQSIVIGTAKPDETHENSATKDLIIYTIQGPFFFGAAEKIEHALADTHTDPKGIIFCLQNVPFIDMTGLETMAKIIDQYHKRGVKVYLAQANKNVAQKLANLDIITATDSKKIFDTVQEAIRFYHSKTTHPE